MKSLPPCRPPGGSLALVSALLFTTVLAVDSYAAETPINSDKTALKGSTSESDKSLPENEQFAFLAKPFALSALVAKVKETMAPS